MPGRTSAGRARAVRSTRSVGAQGGRGQRKPAPWSRRVCAASSACFTRERTKPRLARIGVLAMGHRHINQSSTPPQSKPHAPRMASTQSRLPLPTEQWTSARAERKNKSHESLAGAFKQARRHTRTLDTWLQLHNPSGGRSFPSSRWACSSPWLTHGHRGDNLSCLWRRCRAAHVAEQHFSPTV